MIASTYAAEDASGVWVFLETDTAGLQGVSIELLGRARQLATQLSADLTGILIGDHVEDVGHEAFAYGADRVLLAQDRRLNRYVTEAYARVVGDAVLAGRPSILLIGATPDGRDLAGRLAVRLRTGLTADCTGLDLEAETGLLLGRTTGFGGGVTATIKCPIHRPQMATVRPGVFARPVADDSRSGRIEPLMVSLSQADLRVDVLERTVGSRDVDLTQARVVVVGGRGVSGDFGLLEQLAELLGGEIGATRVAVDAGWAERERQIGQTGCVTRPDLAFVCGASGAMQFSVGIQDAGTIVAVNTDPDAPIFDSADYVVVEDVKALLPPLVDRLRAVVE